MGTNYYARFNICECCDRYDQRHVGKSSGGWSFSFRGPSSWEKLEPLGIGGSDVNIPATYREWLAVLRRPNVELFDEYDRPVTVDWFAAKVEAKRHGRRHVDDFPDNGWIDEDGHSFTGREFS